MGLLISERLIVAADFDCQSRCELKQQVLRFADSIADTGVIIKVNFALRACGYDLIDELKSRGLKVFADLKLTDISATLQKDGYLLREAAPELLTVMCANSQKALRALKGELPYTEVLGVTVLTEFTEAEVDGIYKTSVEDAVVQFARTAFTTNLDGLISAPKEVNHLRAIFGKKLTLNTPAIRPAWATVKGDDQNLKRSMTPVEAIAAGADRLVVGRPITGADKPLDAVMRTLEEIEKATS
ncbi:orotidine-5'-phosphate decarboxylase [Candidatus Kaiserbacteria bacterium]|nr:orotidine-5'-phosphate decarboxylase [Candidatus Kaiserbacteria bacterium]